MRQFFIHCFLLFFVCYSSSTLAESASFYSDAAVKKSGDDIILIDTSTAKSAQVFFFKNKSTNSIFLEHPSSNPGASAGWSTFLRPGNWAALVLNKKNFTIHCAMIEPGKVVTLNCEDTLAVYQLNELTIKLKGNYWVAEDKSWENFIKILQKKSLAPATTELVEP